MNGKKRLFLFLGSSVTYGFANGGVSFVEYVEEALGIPCVKEAVNGTTLADTGSDSYVSRLHALKLEGVTHLIVQLSTNDVVRGVPRGCLSPSRNKDAFDLSTTIGAVEYIVAYAKERWNCAVTYYTNPDFGRGEYGELVNELYRVAEKWGAGILDFYSFRGMKKPKEKELASYMADPVHPNGAGYLWMGKIFAEYFGNHFPNS